jgi:hypothetical protein
MDRYEKEKEKWLSFSMRIPNKGLFKSESSPSSPDYGPKDAACMEK